LGLAVPHIDPAQHARRRDTQNCVVLDHSQQRRAAHLDALRRFARRTDISEELLVAAYERERHRLAAGAKVERFVDILAEKRAKRALAAGKR
jgi:pyrroloquinoline quinone (PQQ) biosynthesis protein C